ncbi:MAG: hypothetical protein MJE77_38960 [Proteobacteria bacterium]|nr:hypothetical protein [Pseudomonadota bacterium]
MFRSNLYSHRTILIALSLSALIGACGSDDDSNGPNTPGSGPLWAITTQVFGTGGKANSYIVVTDTLDAATPLSLDNAVELPGRSLGVGRAAGGAVFATGDESAVLTRYQIDSAALTKGDSISFAGQGLTRIGEYGSQFYFVSGSKAYFFDPQTLQIILWNPSAMTITDTIDLAELTEADTVVAFSQSPILRQNDALIMLVGWRGADNLSIVSKAGVVVLDVTDDSVQIATDDRCGYVRDGVLGSDGKLYMATEAYGTAVHRLDASAAPKPCLLRFDIENRQFDAAFHVELESLVGGAAAGSLIAGPSSGAYLRVLDENLATIDNTTHPRSLASQAAWQWYDLALGDTVTATAHDGLPAGAGSVIVLDAGDREVIPEFAPDFSLTEFRVVDSGAIGDVTLEVPGLVFSLVQLR